MGHLDSNSIRRAQVYVPVILLVYTGQFLYINLNVVMRGQELSAQGELFVIYSFFNLAMVIFELG